jgi:hypothetical protein
VSAALKRLNQTFRDMPDVIVDKLLLRELVTPLCSDTDISPEVRLLALKITPVIFSDKNMLTTIKFAYFSASHKAGGGRRRGRKELRPLHHSGGAGVGMV